MDFFAQFIGFIAFLLLVASFQFDNRKTILLFHLSASLFWTAHYGLLEAWTAAAITGIVVFRSLIFFYRFEKKWAGFIAWPYFFGAIFALGTVLTWESWYSVLPLMASLMATYAFWNEKPKIIRFVFLLDPFLWGTYNIIVGSYPGLMTNVFIFLSVIIGVIRFDVLKGRKK